MHPTPIEPQFRIFAERGDVRLAVTLPDDAEERKEALGLGRDFPP